MFLKHLFYIQMCFSCYIICSSSQKSDAAMAENVQGISSTFKTLVYPTGTRLTATGKLLRTLTLGTLPIKRTTGALPTDRTLLLEESLGTLPTIGTIGSFSEGSFGTMLTGETTMQKMATTRILRSVTMETKKMAGTFPTREVSDISLSGAESITIPTKESKQTLLTGKSSVTMTSARHISLPSSSAASEQSTFGFPFTLPPWFNFHSPLFNTGPLVANLSDVLEKNSDIIATFATELYSLCTGDAEICQTKIASSSLSNSSSKCCVYCSCTVYCKAERNCCPLETSKVAQYKDFKYFTFLFCQSTYKLLTEATATTLYNTGYKDEEGHLFVSYCPDSASEEDKYFCENMARTDMFSVLDTVPVTDTIDGTQFANGFCAACHNIPIERIKSWNVGVSCLNNETVLQKEDIENFVRRNEDCYVMYMPPDGVSDSALFSCTPNLIDRCNTYGTWYNYDVTIESQCLDPRLEKIYRVIVNYVEYRFKNVFCAVCNGIKADEVDDCQPVSIGPLNVPALHSLFTFSGAKIANTGINRRICAVGTTFIPILGVCKKVHCIAPYLVDILRNTCSLRAVASPFLSLHIPVMISLHKIIPFSNHDVLQLAIIRSLESAYSNLCLCDTSFIYELDVVYHPDMANETLQHKNIKTVYISLHLIGSSKNFDYASFTENVNNINELTMLDSKVKVEVSHSKSDSLFYGNHAREMLIKQNPYNQAAFVQYPSISDNCTCSNNGEIATGYPLHFMECPSVLVALEDFDITRVESGLLIGRNIIRLNNVRSLNASHAYICIDAMDGEGLTSLENSLFKRFVILYISLSSLIAILLL